MELDILDLGLLDYEKALEIQYELLEKVQNGECNDTLILVEHPPVITLGKNAVEGNVLFNKETLKEKGVDLYNINRGGDVTYHGPGQLVGYPIFNLKKNHNRSIKRFIENLEDVFIDLIRDKFSLDVSRHECNAGVWYGEEKIVALGLAVKKGVTMHGFAFNIDTKLEHFNLIVPCGLTSMGVTSISKILKETINIENIKTDVIEQFVNKYKFSNYNCIKYVVGGDNE